VKKAKLDFAVNAIRRSSYLWDARTEAKNAARIRRGYYTCAFCKGETRAKDMNLDHIVPVKDVRGINLSLDEIVDRILADPGGWQLLCLVCHKHKSNLENKCRAEIEASIKKMHKEIEKISITGGIDNLEE
jgi:hypothetical protein